MEVRDRLGFDVWRFRSLHSLLHLVRLEQKLAFFFSPVATHRVVAPELCSSDARKAFISKVGLPGDPPTDLSF